MKTKIVYVVVSDETDIYLEQALLSIFSLRKYNPNAYVELVVDKITYNTIIGKRSEIKKYVNNITTIDVPAKYNKGPKSRWLKTNLRNLIEGDYLFIDNDTIITDTLDEIDKFDGIIWAVKDKHAPVEQNKDKDKLLLWSKQDGWTYSDDLKYFNSGVMYVRDSDFTHDFYREWNKRWQICTTKYSRYYDQSPLAATNEFYHYPIKELAGEWNCQPTNGIAFLYKAKIMHYWGYNRKYYAWMFYDKKIIRDIKESGSISKEISNLVNNAREAFIMPNEIIADKELEIYYSPVFQVCISNKTIFALFSCLSKLWIKMLRFRGWIRNKL
jgi:hypothetical protein